MEPANGGIGTTGSALINRIDISGEKEVGAGGILPYIRVCVRNKWQIYFNESRTSDNDILHYIRYERISYIPKSLCMDGTLRVSLYASSRFYIHLNRMQI